MKQLINKIIALIMLGITMVILYSVIALTLIILVSFIAMILIWAIDGTISNPVLFIPVDIILLSLIYWLSKKGFFKKVFEGLRGQIRRNL